MIRIENTENFNLTFAHVQKWHSIWQGEEKQLYKKLYLYLNKDANNKTVLKLPFAKKLVFTSAATTVGEGVTFTPASTFSELQKTALTEIESLYKKQTMSAHDANLIKDGCIFGRGYELAYMSNDEVPVPKVALIPPTNAFVVYDDTVETNSLFGVYFNNYKDNEEKEQTRFYVYDKVSEYVFDSAVKSAIAPPIAHNMGRVPLTEYRNNEEEQSDFEQVIELMKDRTAVHELNLKDMKDIAKNYLKGRNVDFAGTTAEEKKNSMNKAVEMQLIELTTEQDNVNDDITLLSKNENYSSVDIFGRDIDSKIYDLSMIPNLSDDNFAGNQSGVALKLKLMPFKNLVEAKDPQIERVQRRRLKMYMNALSQNIAVFDAADVEITINRTWTENALEQAQIVSTLVATNKFSDEYLVNLMPSADYDTEQTRIVAEIKNGTRQQTTQADPNNFSLEGFNALLRGENA